MRHPEDITPSDLVKAPVILALLIVTSVLERFELMPRIRAAVRKTPDQLAAHVEAGEMPDDLSQEQEQFCDSHCCWSGHHPDCARATWEKSAACSGEAREMEAAKGDRHV